MSQSILSKKEENFYCLTTYFYYLLLSTSINTINYGCLLKSAKIDDEVFSILNPKFIDLCKKIRINYNYKNSILFNINYFSDNKNDFYSKVIETKDFKNTFYTTFLSNINSIFKDLNISTNDILNILPAYNYIYTLFKDARSSKNKYANFVLDMQKRYGIKQSKDNYLIIKNTNLHLNPRNEIIACSNIYQNLLEQFDKKMLNIFNSISDKVNYFLKNEILTDIPNEVDTNTYVYSRNKNILITFKNYITVLHNLNKILESYKSMEFDKLFTNLNDGTFVTSSDLKKVLGD